MNTKKKEIKNRLMNVLRIQSSSEDESLMKEFIIKSINKIANNMSDDEGKLTYEIDEVGNILVTKTTGRDDLFYFPCVAAHMDTVHDIKQNYRVILEQKSDVRTRARNTCHTPAANTSQAAAGSGNKAAPLAPVAIDLPTFARHWLY